MSPIWRELASFAALLCASKRASARVRRSEEVARFLTYVEREVLGLQRELRAGTYRPGAYRVFEISDPKPRLICAAPFRDRVVHHALCAPLEPLFEASAHPHSFACRKGKGVHAALAHVQALCGRHQRFVKLDIRHHFETLRHADVLRRVEQVCPEPEVLALVARILECAPPHAQPGRGLPIGNLTSQHFANHTLSSLDFALTAQPGVIGYARYMDDFLIFGDCAAALREAEHFAEVWLRNELGLELKSEATRRGPIRAGVPFLGLRLWPRQRRFDAARVRRLRRRFKAFRKLEGSENPDEGRLQSQLAAWLGWAEIANTHRLRRSWLKPR